MSRWNRLGDVTCDVKETSLGRLNGDLWEWLVSAIDDVLYLEDSPVTDVEFFIRDDDSLMELWTVELMDNHYSDGSVTRRVIFRPNKKAKRRKYI